MKIERFSLFVEARPRRGSEHPLHEPAIVAEVEIGVWSGLKYDNITFNDWKIQSELHENKQTFYPILIDKRTDSNWHPNNIYQA